MLHDRDEQVKDELAFAQHLEHFRKCWSGIVLATDGPRAAADFETELYYLLDRTRRIAQAPLVAQMSAAMALAPPSPIFIETPKKQ